MNNLPDLKLVTNERWAQQFSCDERLEDYLEHLIAPLIGIMPYSERKAFRQEAHVHLEGLIREYVYQGQSLQTATETALREFGEPWKVGQSFLQEWLLGTPRQRPALLLRKATWTAFAWFGTASMLTLLLLEQVTFSPNQEALLPAIGLLAFLAPFAAGSLVGAMAPAQAENGVRNAVLLLVVHAFATGILLQPRYEGLALAGWQLIFWLPTGRISAKLTATCIRQSRRQRFWQVAR